MFDSSHDLILIWASEWSLLYRGTREMTLAQVTFIQNVMVNQIH